MMDIGLWDKPGTGSSVSTYIRGDAMQVLCLIAELSCLFLLQHTSPSFRASFILFQTCHHFDTMKFSTFVSFGLTAMSALAAPTPSMVDVKRSIEKRAASLEDVATVGYATTNGGTTGGKGGKTVKVSTLAELTAAVKGDDAAIVLITGPIKGSGDNVKVGSNKSIIGQDSKTILENFTITVKGVKNVILRNFAVQKVVGGDAIAIQKVRCPND